MTPAEFQASLEEGIRRHASECVRTALWKEAVALEESRREFAELLPQGSDTPGFHFCSVVNAEDSSRIGETWYTVQTKGGKIHFWVDWLWIAPPHRRRGHASEVLALLSARAAELGAERIGLGVMDDNDAAKALYARFGFLPWRAQLMKMLTTADRT
jgi:ribosomal protein S18 acetylase RimI-like enzyme